MIYAIILPRARESYKATQLRLQIKLYDEAEWMWWMEKGKSQNFLVDTITM